MMLLILYIVQAICNQTLPPEQILLVFCFYLKYINLLFEMLSLYTYKFEQSKPIMLILFVSSSLGEMCSKYLI